MASRKVLPPELAQQLAGNKAQPSKPQMPAEVLQQLGKGAAAPKGQQQLPQDVLQQLGRPPAAVPAKPQMPVEVLQQLGKAPATSGKGQQMPADMLQQLGKAPAGASAAAAPPLLPESVAGQLARAQPGSKAPAGAAAVNGTPSKVAPMLAPTPQRPAPKPSEPAVVPILNAYVKLHLSKAESASYNDAIRLLGEVRVTGRSGHKQMLEQVLPKLSLYEVVPVTLAAQLLQLISGTDDTKVVRYVYYLLQLLLGVGSAGTPSPTSARMRLQPPQLVLPGPAAALHAGGALVPAADQTLMPAAGGGTDGEKAVLQACDAALSRAEQEEPSFQPERRRKGVVQAAEAPELQHIAFVAARAAALKGQAGSIIGMRSFLGICSPNAIAARHAFALAAAAARTEAPRVVSEQKDLPGLVNSAVAQHESSGLLLGSQQPKKASPDRARLMTSNLNLADRWARVHLARLCAALTFAEWTSPQAFMEGAGAPYWRMLVLLATRDVEALVSLEATRALVGHQAQQAPGLTGAAGVTPQEEMMANRVRVRAWTNFVAQAGSACDYVPGIQTAESGSLAGAVGARIREALSSTSPPLVCSAARTAGAIAESYARAAGASVALRSARGAAGKLLQLLGRELLQVLDGHYSAAERCAALEALFWLQVHNPQPMVSPSAILRHVGHTHSGALLSSSKAADEPWPQDLMQALLGALMKVMHAVPRAARSLLESAGAIIAAAPSKFKGDQLAGIWSGAMQLGPLGRSAALQAALEFLGTPAPYIASVGTGPSMEAIGKAAAEEAAWARLQRSTAWWLGENTNAANEEYAGSMEALKAMQHMEAALQSSSPAEVLALQALRKPGLAAVLSHLQHAALTQPWGIRVAAVQAIAKVAVRSDEPYRLQAYSVLKSLSGPDHLSDPDALGVASVALPAVRILDRIYATRVTIEALKGRYGVQHKAWPDSIIESLRDRHNAIYRQIEEQLCAMPPGLYYPLGPKSRALLQGTGLDEVAAAGRPPKKEAPVQAAKDLTTPASPFAEKAAMVHDDSEDESAISRTESELREVRQVERSQTARRESEASPELAPLDLSSLDVLQRELDRKVESTWAKPLAPYEPWKEVAEAATGGEEEPPSAMSHARKPSLEINFDEDAPASRPAPDQVPINQRGVVQFSFDGAMDEEITVDQGEGLEVLFEVDGWYQVVNAAGAMGLVPASFVRLLAPGEASPASIGAAGAALSRPAEQQPLPWEEPMSARAHHKRTSSGGSAAWAQPSSARHSRQSSLEFGAQPGSARAHHPGADQHNAGSWKGFGEREIEQPTSARSDPWSARQQPATPRELNAFASGRLDEWGDEPQPRFGSSFRIRDTDSEPAAQSSPSPQPAAQQPLEPDPAAALPSKQSLDEAVMPSRGSLEAARAAGAQQQQRQGTPTAGAASIPEEELVPAMQQPPSTGHQRGASALSPETEKRLDDDFAALDRLDRQVDGGVAALQAPQRPPGSPTKAGAGTAAPAAPAVAPSPQAAAAAPASTAAAAPAASATLPQQQQQPAQPAALTTQRFDSFGTQFEDDWLPAAQPAAQPASAADYGAPAGLAHVQPGSSHARTESDASLVAATPRRTASTPLAPASPAEQPEEGPIPATVRFAFEAENEEELTVNPGEQVLVEAEVDGWYSVVRGAARGLVPASYIQLLA